MNLCGLHAFPAFSRCSLFRRVWSVHKSSCHFHVHFPTLNASLNQTLIEVWLFVPWGRGDFITYVYPKYPALNLDRSMVICSGYTLHHCINIYCSNTPCLKHVGMNGQKTGTVMMVPIMGCWLRTRGLGQTPRPVN